jgi:hypothetical protein
MIKIQVFYLNQKLECIYILHRCTYACACDNRAGLPDVIFSNQKSQIGYILEGLGMENVCLFNAHLEHFTTIWHFLWPFGTFCGNLVLFPVLVCCTKNNMATLRLRQNRIFE